MQQKQIDHVQIHRIYSSCGLSDVYKRQILTDRFNKESDVDFIVNFDKAQVTDYFSNFFDLKYALEDILGREVDLLEEHAIRNHYLKENIEQTKALIYG